jgi:hypothetical protein
MADDPKPPAPAFHSGCLAFVLAEFVAVLLGIGLAALALRANAPPPAVAAAFFAPPVVMTLIGGAVFVPRLVRAYREFQRAHPSPESVAAAAGGAGVEAEPTPFRTAAPPKLPGMPTVPVVSTEPGRVLACRLDRAGLPAGCKFVGSVFAALFWNGIVSVFVWNLAADWNKMGAARWFMAAFLSPFVIVGGVLVLVVLVSALQWFASMLAGRLEVELAEHPLSPGGVTRARVEQRGLFGLAGVSVSLVCTESASYMAGTSKTTATREVSNRRLVDSDATGGRLPLEFDLCAPAGAMHSFEAPNNKIDWTLRVTGRLMGLPFRDEFRLALVPAPPGEAA